MTDRGRGAAISLGGPPLGLAELTALAAGAPAFLAPEAGERVRGSRALIEDVLRRGEAVYGVNTGFGALKSVRIGDDDLGRLQLNLLRSHAAGYGPELERGAVTLMLALRAHSLALGASGVRPALIEHLLAMRDRDLLPVVPSRGSLGASGDLIPLSHLALGVIGEGEIRRDGRVGPAGEQYRAAGLAPLQLAAKEGLAMRDRDLLPVVPSRGSLGASGDLIPLSHLALGVIGEGEIRRDGRVGPAGEQYRAAGLAPLQLAAKEGLALINGTQAAAALGALALSESFETLRAAHAACALSVEAMRGSATPFDARVHALRPHEGQADSAQAVRRLLAGSAILASHAGCGRIQDAYSLRCAPQVLGASIQAARYALGVVVTEVNSVTDNPLCFPDTGEVVSAGNFHGQPLAQALDFLAIGMAEVGSIAERRSFLLLDASKSDLPAFLSAHAGLSSGLMIVQYLQAALVSENKMLAQPASVDSIPTSAGQEDHVSMAMHAAVKALTLARNVRRIVAAELLCAAQAVEFLRPLRTSEPLEELLADLRRRVPRLEEDRRQDEDLARLDAWIAEGGVAAAAGIAGFDARPAADGRRA